MAENARFVRTWYGRKVEIPRLDAPFLRLTLKNVRYIPTNELYIHQHQQAAPVIAAMLAAELKRRQDYAGPAGRSTRIATAALIVSILALCISVGGLMLGSQATNNYPAKRYSL